MVRTISKLFLIYSSDLRPFSRISALSLLQHILLHYGVLWIAPRQRLIPRVLIPTVGMFVNKKTTREVKDYRADCI